MFAFSAVGLNWEDYVRSSQQFKRPLEVESLCGNANKARSEILWNPQVLAPELAQIMVEADLKRNTFLY
jgi:GDPmannose 4,6-dehydratase